MSDKSVLYTAVYDDVNSALADLDGVEQLHHQGLVGTYDAAVIDQEDGKPHIVKRMDRPSVRVIPEVFGSGTLPRKELHEAARELTAGNAALIVLGEPKLGEAFDKAITKAGTVAKREFDAAADDLGRELSGAFAG